MRILLLITFISFPSFGSIDRTRLQMELDYLLEDARQVKLPNTANLKPLSKQNSVNNLKFSRKTAKSSDILSLEDEFDKIQIKHSAPSRNQKKKFIESKTEKKNTRVNGLIPKDVFKKD